MSRLGAVLSIAAALAPTAAVGSVVTLVPVEEVRPIWAPSRGDGRYDPAIPYSRRTPAHKRRVLLRRGAR